MSPSISIVIPVYNAELYIRECLESILGQTVNKYQIICVDDGSTDSSVKIIKEYLLDDDRVLLLRQSNQGPAVARNNGLKHAKGDYVWWIDADDWIQPNAVEVLQKAIEISDADIIGFASNSFNNKTRQFINTPHRSLDSIPHEFVQKTFAASDAKEFLFDLPLEAWARIFKTEFLFNNKIKFDPFLKILDDSLFVNEGFLKASKIYYIKNKLYHYREMNPYSLVNSLNYSNEKYYLMPIYMSDKCNQIILESNYALSDFKKMILRNLDRIIYLLPRIKKPYQSKFYYAFKEHLKKYGLNSSGFLDQETEMKEFLNRIEKQSYFRFLLSKFMYQRIVTTKHIRVTVLGIRLYKKKLA